MRANVLLLMLAGRARVRRGSAVEAAGAHMYTAYSSHPILLLTDSVALLNPRDVSQQPLRRAAPEDDPGLHAAVYLLQPLAPATPARQLPLQLTDPPAQRFARLLQLSPGNMAAAGPSGWLLLALLGLRRAAGG